MKMKIESLRQVRTGRTNGCTNKRRLALLELLLEPKKRINKFITPVASGLVSSDIVGSVDTSLRQWSPITLGPAVMSISN